MISNSETFCILQAALISLKFEVRGCVFIFSKAGSVHHCLFTLQLDSHWRALLFSMSLGLLYVQSGNIFKVGSRTSKQACQALF